jgi:hypothetical protein
MSVTSSKRARGEQKDENIQLGQLSYLEWTAKFKDDYPFEFTTTKKLLDEQLPETLKRLQAANNNAVKSLAAAEKLATQLNLKTIPKSMHINMKISLPAGNTDKEKEIDVILRAAELEAAKITLDVRQDVARKMNDQVDAVFEVESIRLLDHLRECLRGSPELTPFLEPLVRLTMDNAIFSMNVQRRKATLAKKATALKAAAEKEKDDQDMGDILADPVPKVGQLVKDAVATEVAKLRKELKLVDKSPPKNAAAGVNPPKKSTKTKKKDTKTKNTPSGSGQQQPSSRSSSSSSSGNRGARGRGRGSGRGRGVTKAKTKGKGKGKDSANP